MIIKVNGTGPVLYNLLLLIGGFPEKCSPMFARGLLRGFYHGIKHLPETLNTRAETTIKLRNRGLKTGGLHGRRFKSVLI